MQKTSEVSNERYLEVMGFIEEVCKNNLNEEYLFLAESLCKEIFELKEGNLNKGKANSWACGIVHALGLKNGLFTNKIGITIKAGDLYKLFDVSSSTGLSKSKEVRTLIDLEEDKWLITCNKSDYIDNSKTVDNEIKCEEKQKEKIKEETLDEVCVSKVEAEIIEDEDLKKANKIANEAWNQKNYKKKAKLAKEALKISENCAEAYIILSYDNSLSINEQKILVLKAVEAAKNVIGEENINKYIGKFLDLEVTRPYYSAKYRLGNLLWNINEKLEAIKEFTDLINLDPEDRLLIRGVLLSWLITENLDEEVLNVLNKYKNDYLPSTKFSKALYLFKIGKLEEAERALRIANASNPFVIDYIIKQKRIPTNPPELKSLGTEEDAVYYMKNAETAWNSVNGARSWVKELKNRL
ncbi:DUF6398 domain-containing protein [Clostridium tertium]|uniref:DUF6398 domain-containing protein n=1 Tax=Clostridium tertium TaxID=1559 RepID=UPI001AE2FDD9|nr:DUF6398 domain-containing protein [Clostridium tertium]MBP1867039.1 tetratricopeptide (TPR) repeat protein [Clostridium tertium]